MRFVEVRKEDIEVSYKKTKLQSFLEEFVKSGFEVAKVEWQGNYKRAESCYVSITKSIKRYKHNVVCFIRNGNVYLERVDVE